MDLSQILFYSGIIGMAAIALIGITVTLLLARGKKKLKTQLNAEYGEPQ